MTGFKGQVQIVMQLPSFSIIRFGIWSLLFFATTVGCGDGRLDVSPVRGRVVYKGQGVPKAVVIFHPSEEIAQDVKKMRPFAYADNDGNFELKTYIEGDGAPPGDYRVTIVARSTQGGKRRSKDARVDEEETSIRGIQIPAAVSKKYANADTSGIQVTVHEGENNLEPFVL